MQIFFRCIATLPGSGDTPRTPDKVPLNLEEEHWNCKRVRGFPPVPRCIGQLPHNSFPGNPESRSRSRRGRNIGPSPFAGPALQAAQAYEEERNSSLASISRLTQFYSMHPECPESGNDDLLRPRIMIAGGL